jgi:membrane protease YdiL (CAAX protease family)
MMTIYSDKLPSTLAQAAHDVRDWLRRSPAVRGGLYFGGAVLILNRASACFPDDSQESLLAIHLTTFPFGAALTTVMQQIEGRPVRIQFTTEDLDHLMQGAALGASAFGILTAIGLAKGWLRAPAWGWEHASLSGVLTSIAKHSGGHFLLAWNEETVFRGYGFAVLREAIGQPAAIAVLIPLFALAHPGTLQVWLGQAAVGTALTALRLSSNSLWAPIGYHWAWNVAQTAFLGPPDGMPSLRPLITTGPERWVGRPGHPEPGVLSALVQAGMAATIAAVGWFRRRQRKP